MSPTRPTIEPPSTAERTVLVVAGGDTAPVAGLVHVLPPIDAVVAADSGVRHAHTLGVRVDVVVGDLDSARPSDLDDAARAGAVIERYPTAKDKTDLELALDRALALGGPGARLVVVASVGGRLDHALANLLVLASHEYAACSIEAFVDRWQISVLRDETRRMAVRPGATVTLLAVVGDAVCVTTSGLHYPLENESLLRSSTRGVSNVAIGNQIDVDARGGVLFVLREWAD